MHNEAGVQQSEKLVIVRNRGLIVPSTVRVNALDCLYEFLVGIFRKIFIGVSAISIWSASSPRGENVTVYRSEMNPHVHKKVVFDNFYIWRFW